MSTTVWLCADTLSYPEGGGHRWAYLNWALGLKALDCRVVWLEAVDLTNEPAETARGLASLQVTLRQYGLEGSLALCSRSGEPLAPDLIARTVPLETAREADLLLNIGYESCKPVLPLFRRKAFLDIDPGLSQVWAGEGQSELLEHDVYFTIGETVGRPGALFPDLGIDWQHTTPCVALDAWPVAAVDNGAPFTTVSHWVNWQDWVTFGDESFGNDKRTGFLPLIELPRRTEQPLELAICLGTENGQWQLPPWELEERDLLEGHGWRVVHSYSVAGTAWDYQEYVRSSRGELSWVKPSCLRLQNAWLSDRTPCYLASGKPAVLQHTGPSRLLDDAEPIFRYRDVEEAARHIETVAGDYDRYSAAARALAEELFDARTVAGSVLERAL